MTCVPVEPSVLCISLWKPLSLLALTWFNTTLLTCSNSLPRSGRSGAQRWLDRQTFFHVAKPAKTVEQEEQSANRPMTFSVLALARQSRTTRPYMCCTQWASYVPLSCWNILAVVFLKKSFKGKKMNASWFRFIERFLALFLDVWDTKDHIKGNLCCKWPLTCDLPMCHANPLASLVSQSAILNGYANPDR